MRLGKKHTATHHEQRQRLQLPKGTYWDREYLEKWRKNLLQNPRKQEKATTGLFFVKYLKRIMLFNNNH